MKTAHLSLRILAKHGISRERAALLGGVVGTHNVSFAEGTEGFARVQGKLLTVPTTPPRPVGGTPCSMKKRGPKLWKIFHEWTLTAQPEPEVWLDSFQKAIRCPDCVAEFVAIRKALPFVPGFEWGVDVHNRVNVKLGKAVVSVEAAREKLSAVIPPSSDTRHEEEENSTSQQ